MWCCLESGCLWFDFLARWVELCCIRLCGSFCGKVELRQILCSVASKPWTTDLGWIELACIDSCCVDLKCVVSCSGEAEEELVWCGTNQEGFTCMA